MAEIAAPATPAVSQTPSTQTTQPSLPETSQGSGSAQSLTSRVRRRPSELGALSQEPEPEVTAETDVVDPNAGAESPADLADELANAVIDDGGEEDAEGDEPASEQVFGMEPDALLAELRAGKLPAQMLEQVYCDIEWPDANGNPQVQRMTLTQMRDEFRSGAVMRRSDYTRKSQELAKERQQAQGIIRQRGEEMQALRNPEALRAWCEDNGLFESLEATTKALAGEFAAFQRMSPEQREAYIERLELQAERKRLAKEKAEHEANQRSQRVEQYRVQNERVLAEHFPASFAKFKIQEGKLSKQIFGEEIRAIAAAKQTNQVTPEMVYEAAQGTLERLQEMARYQEPASVSAVRAAQPAPRQAPSPQGTRAAAQLPPTPLPGARPPGQQQPQQPRGRKRIGDFGTIMEKRGNGFRG